MTQRACALAADTTASANDRRRIPSALTVPWLGAKRGSEPCSQGTTQYHSFQNQKAHIRLNRRSFRYSAEPYNPQEQHFSDQDHKENKYRDSRSTCRVSGAQFLTRLGYSLDAVQLIGRWGSDAIKRYIQDSPLVRPLQRTEHQTDDHIRKIVQDQMTRSFNQFWIVHSNSGITHIPAITETCTDNRRWRTICGWHYGTSTFQKTYVKPDTNRCLKCFRYTNDRDTQELDLSGSDTDELWNKQDKKERSLLRDFPHTRLWIR